MEIDAISKASLAALADFGEGPAATAQEPASTEAGAAGETTDAPAAPAASASATPTPVAPPPTTPAAQPPAGADKIDEPTPVEPVIPAATWKLKHNGRVVEVSDPEELRTLAQKGFDYTQKSQATAKAERETLELQKRLVADYDAKVAEMRAKVTSVMSDDAQLESWLTQLRATRAGQPMADPAQQELATTGQVQEIAQRTVQAQLTQERKAAQEAAARAWSAVQFKQKSDDYGKQIDSTLDAVSKAHPELADIDGIGQLLLNDIAPELAARIAADPETEVPFADVAKAIADKAALRATKEKARIDRHTQMAVARAAKAAKPAAVQTAPPGGVAAGSGVTQPPGKPMKIGSAELRNAAIEDFRRYEAENKGKR